MPTDPTEPPPAYCIPHAAGADEHLLRWQAHVDAGRIGHRPAPDPAILANHARTARILRRRG